MGERARRRSIFVRYLIDRIKVRPGKPWPLQDIVVGALAQSSLSPTKTRPPLPIRQAMVGS